MRSQLSRRLGETKLGRQYEQMVQEVRRNQEEMDHFVRALSHDMNANFMLLDNSFSQFKAAVDLRDRPNLAELASHVDACLRESRRFLDDLVGFARTGRAEMEPSWVDPTEVVDEVLYEQRQTLGELGIAVDVHKPLPRVWCNRHRLKQIISNLIRNAVKYGCDPKQPRISVSPVRHSHPCEATGLAIRDNGPGINPKYHEEIFLPGRRLPNARSEGSGMGLAIVRKIAEFYGGSVSVDTSCPAGTTLLVLLPCPPSGRQELACDRAAGGDLCVGRDAPHQGPQLRPHQPFA